MRFRFTLFLLVANLITFGLILYESGKSEVVESARQSFFSMGIDKIEIPSGENGKTFTLECREIGKRNWEITKPYRWVADLSQVNGLLNGLRAFGSRGSFSLEEVENAGGSLADYGLDKASKTFFVTDDAGTHVLQIGRETPDRKGFYVYAPDRKEIVLVDNTLIELLSKKAETFRSKQIFSIPSFKVNSFSVRSEQKGGAEKRIGLSRIRLDGENIDEFNRYQWQFDTPIVVAARTQAVEEKLKNIIAQAYAEFDEESNLVNLERSGLKSPKMRISLEGTMFSQALLIGNPVPNKKGELYAKLEDNDSIFTIDSALADFWSNPFAVLEELRDPKILSFDETLLKSIKIDDGKHSLVLHRTETTGHASRAATKEGASVKAVNDGEIDLKSDAKSLGAMEVPEPPPQSGSGSNYAFWQMPVAPGSHVKSVTPVEPEAIGNLVRALLNLEAVKKPGDEDLGRDKKFFNKFASDSASNEELEEFGFNNYAYLVEIQLAGDSEKAQSEQKIMLTIAPPVKPGYPYHAKVGNSIFAIDEKIMDVLTVDPMRFRERSIYKMPNGSTPVSLKLTDVSESSERVVLDEKCPADVGNWVAALEEKNDRDAQELLALIACVTNLEAASFLSEPFTQDFAYDYLDAGAPETWRYRLEVGVKAANAQAPTVETYYLTKRLGGTFQLAGYPKQNCVFRMKQSFIDAIHKLTFARDASKDIPDIPIPDAVEKAPPSTLPVNP